MKVQLLKDMAVAANGHTVEERKKGDVITIDEEGGNSLCRQALAVVVDDSDASVAKVEPKKGKAK